MMHMLSLRKVWYCALQRLLDSSETSCLGYNRVVDILPAVGKSSCPQQIERKVFLPHVQDSCFSSTLFFALVLFLQYEESQHS